MIFHKQKDIVLVPFLFTDASTKKRRPALIVSNDTINKNWETPDFVALAITSKIRRGSYGIQIGNDDLKKGSLPSKSEIQCDKIFTIEKSLVIKKLCTLNDTVFSLVKSKLAEVFK
ncbi:MAG TPA: type II toxin-antitoxin system PemK/MazF family toxin [Phycisphaerales bacterium]|nr:type II toxin-antitoxin system PemK/MazF family toxin [Phycisphaerales bacterium]